MRGEIIVGASRISDGVFDWDSYKDVGCELSPSCLNCPLERCKYDEPDITPQMRRRREKLTRASALISEGKNVYEIAKIMGVSLRSAYKYVHDVYANE